MLNRTAIIAIIIVLCMFGLGCCKKNESKDSFISTPLILQGHRDYKEIKAKLFGSEHYLLNKGDCLKQDKNDLEKCRAHIKDMLYVCNGNPRLTDGALAYLYNALRSPLSKNLPSEGALELLLLFDEYIEDKNELYAVIREYYIACDRMYKKHELLNAYYTDMVAAKKRFVHRKYKHSEHQKSNFLVYKENVSLEKLDITNKSEVYSEIEKWSNGQNKYKVYRIKRIVSTNNYPHCLITKKEYKEDSEITIYLRMIGQINRPGDCGYSTINLEEDGTAYEKNQSEIRILKEEWNKERQKFAEYTKSFSKEELQNIKNLRAKADSKFQKCYLGGGRLYLYEQADYCIEDLSKETHNF